MIDFAGLTDAELVAAIAADPTATVREIVVADRLACALDELDRLCAEEAPIEATT